MNGTSRSSACQYTSTASAARSALASAGAGGIAICVGVMPARLTASGADRVAQPARAAERDLLEVGRVARLAGVEKGPPRRRVYLAARVVRQGPRVGADLVGVARLVAVVGVRGDGGLADLRAQASRTSTARRRMALSIGRICGPVAAACAAAGVTGEGLRAERGAKRDARSAKQYLTAHELWDASGAAGPRSAAILGCALMRASAFSR